jgi:hypothetical protein
MTGSSGVSSTPQTFARVTGVSEYWISRLAGDDNRRCGAFIFIKRAFAFSRRDAPELCWNSPPNKGRGECRVPVAPAAACAVVVSTRVSHRRSPGSPGIPARDGVNGFLRALPGDRACLPPSPARSLLLANLTPASGRQDHTASPSARIALSSAAQPASIASRPYVRDDRETPLV